MTLNERMIEFEVSLVNQPLDDLGSLNERAIERDRRNWGIAAVIEGGREDEQT